jgi:hypothetical protein
MRMLSRLGTLALAPLLASSLQAAPPPEGTCPTLAGTLPEHRRPQDAFAITIEEGMRLGLAQLPLLENLLPREIWQFREVFFYEGMQMEMGPCHRRYPLPDFFEEATRTYAGQSELDDEGNLRGYVAGLPFPQEAIDPEAPDAGWRWAWNFQQRFRGFGPVGSFRLTALPSRLGSVETYRGTFFYVQTAHRADLAESDYRVPQRKKASFVAGGRFAEPFNARHLAWRQLRPNDAEEDWEEPDDTFVYVPSMRKMRRSATAWIDGLFTPRYTVGSEAGGGPVPFGTGDAMGGVEAINPTAGINIQSSENIGRGFTGLALRPNAYRWRFLGEREVIAPLNGVRPGYPESYDRNFGPSGLSVADDRWEIRWAVVIEGLARSCSPSTTSAAAATACRSRWASSSTATAETGRDTRSGPAAASRTSSTPWPPPSTSCPAARAGGASPTTCSRCPWTPTGCADSSPSRSSNDAVTKAAGRARSHPGLRQQGLGGHRVE